MLKQKNLSKGYISCVQLAKVNLICESEFINGICDSVFTTSKDYSFISTDCTTHNREINCLLQYCQVYLIGPGVHWFKHLKHTCNYSVGCRGLTHSTYFMITELHVQVCVYSLINFG